MLSLIHQSPSAVKRRDGKRGDLSHFMKKEKHLRKLLEDERSSKNELVMKVTEERDQIKQKTKQVVDLFKNHLSETGNALEAKEKLLALTESRLQSTNEYLQDNLQKWKAWQAFLQSDNSLTSQECFTHFEKLLSNNGEPVKFLSKSSTSTYLPTAKASEIPVYLIQELDAILDLARKDATAAVNYGNNPSISHLTVGHWESPIETSTINTAAGVPAVENSTLLYNAPATAGPPPGSASKKVSKSHQPSRGTTPRRKALKDVDTNAVGTSCTPSKQQQSTGIDTSKQHHTPTGTPLMKGSHSGLLSSTKKKSIQKSSTKKSSASVPVPFNIFQDEDGEDGHEAKGLQKELSSLKRVREDDLMKLQQLQKDMSLLQAVSQEAEACLKEKDTALEDAVARERKIAVDLAQFEVDLQRAHDQLHDSEAFIEEMKFEYNEQENTLLKKREGRLDAEQQIRALLLDLEGKDDDMNALMEKQSQQLLSQEEEQSGMKDCITKLHEEVAQLHSTLESSVDELKSQKESFEKQATNMMDKIEEKTAIIDNLNMQLEDAKASNEKEKEELQSLLEASESARLKGESTMLELGQQVEDYRKHCRELEDAAQVLRATSGKQSAALEEELSQVRALLHTSEASRIDLESAYQSQLTTMQNLQEESGKECTSLKHKNEKLAGEVQSLVQDISSKDEAMKALLEEKSSLQKEQSNAIETTAEFREQVHALEAASSEATLQAEALRQANRLLQEQLVHVIANIQQQQHKPGSQQQQQEEEEEEDSDFVEDIRLFNTKMKSLEKQLADAIVQHGQLPVQSEESTARSRAMISPLKAAKSLILSPSPSSSSTSAYSMTGAPAPGPSPGTPEASKTLNTSLVLSSPAAIAHQSPPVAAINDLFAKMHALKQQSKSRALRSIEKISALQSSLAERDHTVESLTARIRELEEGLKESLSAESEAPREDEDTSEEREKQQQMKMAEVTAKQAQIEELTAALNSVKTQAKARASQSIQRIKQLQLKVSTQSTVIKQTESKISELELSLQKTEMEMLACQEALLLSEERLHNQEVIDVKHSAEYKTLQADYVRLKVKVEQKNKEIMRLQQQMQKERLQFQTLKKSLVKLDDLQHAVFSSELSTPAVDQTMSAPASTVSSSTATPQQLQMTELFHLGAEDAKRKIREQAERLHVQQEKEFQDIQHQLEKRLHELHSAPSSSDKSKSRASDSSLQSASTAGSATKASSTSTSTSSASPQKSANAAVAVADSPRTAELKQLRSTVLVLEEKLLSMQQESAAFASLAVHRTPRPAVNAAVAAAAVVAAGSNQSSGSTSTSRIPKRSAVRASDTIGSTTATPTALNTSTSTCQSTVSVEDKLTASNMALQMESTAKRNEHKKLLRAQKTIQDLQHREDVLQSKHLQAHEEIARLNERLQQMETRQREQQEEAINTNRTTTTTGGGTSSGSSIASQRLTVQEQLAQQKLVQLRQAFHGLINAHSENDVNCHCRCICMILDMSPEQERDVRLGFARIAPAIPTAAVTWEEISTDISSTMWGILNN